MKSARSLSLLTCHSYRFDDLSIVNSKDFKMAYRTSVIKSESTKFLAFQWSSLSTLNIAFPIRFLHISKLSCSPKGNILFLPLFSLSKNSMHNEGRAENYRNLHIFSQMYIYDGTTKFSRLNRLLNFLASVSSFSTHFVGNPIHYSGKFYVPFCN